MRTIWLNGNFLPESEAKLSVYDSALMFGDSVFEMTRSFNKNHFRLSAHLDRLFKSMKYVHITCPYTENQLREACYNLCLANKREFTENDEYRIMINVSRGLLSIYRDAVDVKPGVNVMITVFPLRWTVAGMGKLFDEGINAVVPSQRAIPAYLMDPKVKHRSRLYLQLANIEASKMKGENNWPLLLDTEGYVAEGTGDNFFIVQRGTVKTPIGQNCLRGISRREIKELCLRLDLPHEETQLTSYDILNADEAFMTGTPFCILPVCRLNGSPIYSGQPGSITGGLLALWSELVGVDIKKQIQSWDLGTPPGGSTPYQFSE